MNNFSKDFMRLASVCILLVAIPLFIYLLLDYVPRYLSWRFLSAQEIVVKAKVYSGGVPACLYVVECSSGVPRLNLVSDIRELDIFELKKQIWNRRFHRYCEGATENIVLDFPESTKNSHNISDARWSFYNDRFITNNGHFQGSYVSQYPWEMCTESNVFWGK
jgi:hypothetical protein